MSSPVFLFVLTVTLAAGFSYDESLYLLRSMLGSPAFSLTRRELEGVTFDFVRANEGKISEESLLKWVEDEYIEKYVTTWKMDLAQLMALDAGGRPPFDEVPDMRLFNYDTYIYLNMDSTALANEIAKFQSDDEPYVIMRRADEAECEVPRGFRYTFPKSRSRK